ncbi:PTS mannitol transporter subunit IICBA [Eubacterium aggregans]|uniref:PTS mannitol transporter subunit IICBA n=1 Tax=Eubacterium aggregans TaxID=81409 RepID=UPI0023F0F698|nr:PTS mannitol transporter subunit IICBA [Eubacterium aggregans]MDD4691165.1 PTS mannitol transporter subunit IICBA [Eubacterium aggregans]
MKEKVQSFGRFLSAMVMPNIGAFIAWGLIAALFIETGWLPNEQLAKLVGPMSQYLLPLLIAYTGGKVVNGTRGGVIGAIATMGVIVATDVPMFLGAMIMGPLSGWVIKKFDTLIDGRIKAGFEMLVNNFSIGIIGGALAIFAYYIFAPAMTAATGAMAIGVGFFVEHNILPLASVFIEPAKVLFLNNAINHGILTPLGLQQVEAVGKSIFFLMESNPGPGLGILLAYCIAGKGSAKDTAPGAIIIHFFGGIHEIYFPYVLMNPVLILATIAGGAAGVFTFSLLGAGLVGPASPGSIIAILAMVPKTGGYLGVLAGVAMATAVSFAVALPLLKIFGKDEELEDAIAKKDALKASAKGQSIAVTGDAAAIRHIVFACDAGMGSSAMGATVLAKKLAACGRGDITVEHASVSDIPAHAQIVVTHRDLQERAAHSAPQAQLILITNFMKSPEYDELTASLAGKAPEALPQTKKAPASVETDAKSAEAPSMPEFLSIHNIRTHCPPADKEAVIRTAGQMLVDSGCVDAEYIPAMIEREDSFATNIGNGIAIPHGVEAAKKRIKRTGLSVQIFPEGTLWNDEPVKIVIGIAALGDEHLDILANIATKLSTPEAVDALMDKSPEEIQAFLMKE